MFVKYMIMDNVCFIHLHFKIFENGAKEMTQLEKCFLFEQA